ncbi:MAG: hypothetical protein DYH20_11040, partial [Gammaproteobacteria bacterium PRO9]|nr:hypothetical protein [Gammaproteobacteria bacterium PRO9]
MMSAVEFLKPIIVLAVIALAGCGGPTPSKVPQAPSTPPSAPGHATDEARTTQGRRDAASTSPSSAGPAASADAPGTLHLLGEAIAPGTSRRLIWSSGQSFDDTSGDSPVLVVN